MAELTINHIKNWSVCLALRARIELRRRILYSRTRMSCFGALLTFKPANTVYVVSRNQNH